MPTRAATSVAELSAGEVFDVPEVILRTAEGLVLRKTLLVLAAALGLAILVQVALVEALHHRRPVRLYVPEASLRAPRLADEVGRE